jgi:predicted PurR-regulated permease PerM
MTDAPGAASATQQPKNLRGDILFAFALAVALYTAWHLRDLLMLLYVSALFAVVLDPVVAAVMRLRIGRWQPGRGAAVALLMLGLLLAILFFFALTLPPLLHDLSRFVQEIPQRTAWAIAHLHHIPLLRKIDFQGMLARAQTTAARDAGGVLYSLSNWAARMLDIVSGLVLLVYFLIEGEQVYHWLLLLAPEPRRARLDATLRRAGLRMGRWLIGQLLLMLTLAVSSGIVLSLRYSFALAVLLGVANIIPVAGIFITGMLAMLAAAMDSWIHMLLVLAFGIVYVQVENAFLAPRIMRARVNLAGTAILIALLLGMSLADVAGAMVAVPTAVLVAVLIEEYVTGPAKSHAPLREP